ncbi:MAG: F0F1 ATP synthase subunit B [Gammaproteobacteria bacterium]|nr:F0F1 ATP synthase subunit B [Gammaproteobacteria bacterium]
MNINATLIGQIIAFVLLIIFVNKLLWGPLNRMLADRQKRIADGLAAADKGKHELELSEKRAKDLIQEARVKAAEILAQSEKRASEIVEEAKADARTEAERLVTGAHAEIAQEVNRAKEQLRTQVSTLAAAGASKIIKREIDRRAHDDLLKDLVSQI